MDARKLSLISVKGIQLVDILGGNKLARKEKRSPEFHSGDLTRRWLPTLDTLRNFFLMPTAEMLSVFQTMRDAVLSKINDSTLRPGLLFAPGDYTQSSQPLGRRQRETGISSHSRFSPSDKSTSNKAQGLF